MLHNAIARNIAINGSFHSGQWEKWLRAQCCKMPSPATLPSMAAHIKIIGRIWQREERYRMPSPATLQSMAYSCRPSGEMLMVQCFRVPSPAAFRQVFRSLPPRVKLRSLIGRGLGKQLKISSLAKFPSASDDEVSWAFILVLALIMFPSEVCFKLRWLGRVRCQFQHKLTSQLWVADPTLPLDWPGQLVEMPAASGGSNSDSSSGCPFTRGLCANSRGRPFVYHPQGDCWRIPQL